MERWLNKVNRLNADSCSDTPPVGFDKAKYVLLGQVICYCEQVEAGAKLCAQIMFQDKYSSFIQNAVTQEDCKILVMNGEKGFKIAFIFKYDWVKLIIDELIIKNEENAGPDVLCVWATGKLFGYSDYEISRYLKMHGYL